MADPLYHKFVKHWEEVTELPPQTLGPLTPLYKTAAKHLKVMPWPVFLLVSIVVVGFISYLLGSTVSGIVTLLQRGF